MMADLSFEDRKWLVAWTFQGCERRVWRALHDLDLSPYLPRMRSIDVRNGRKVDVEAPRFPGYVFALASSWRPAAWDEVHDIDGFGGMLRHGEELAVISGMQLASAIMSDILDAIKQVSPSDPLFVSNRKKKRELAWQRNFGRARAA